LEALRVFDDDTDAALEQLLRRNLAAVHIARKSLADEGLRIS
jgi:hypothetical protein